MQLSDCYNTQIAVAMLNHDSAPFHEVLAMCYTIRWEFLHMRIVSLFVQCAKSFWLVLELFSKVLISNHFSTIRRAGGAFSKMSRLISKLESTQCSFLVHHCIFRDSFYSSPPIFSTNCKRSRKPKAVIIMAFLLCYSEIWLNQGFPIRWFPESGFAV